MTITSCLHGVLEDCLPCAQSEAEQALRAARAALADLEAQQQAQVAKDRAALAAFQRYARGVRITAERIGRMTSDWEAIKARCEAGQSADLQHGTLSRPDAAAMIEMTRNRYRTFPDWPMAELMLTRFGEQADEGEEAVGVSGGLVLIGDRSATCVVIVSTHGLYWCFDERKPLWMPYAFVDSASTSALTIGEVEGIAFTFTVESRAFTLLPAPEDEVGFVAMLHALDWTTVTASPVFSERHEGLLRGIRLERPGAMGRHIGALQEIARLLEGRTTHRFAASFRRKGAGVTAISDRHAIHYDVDRGELQVQELSEVDHRHMSVGQVAVAGMTRKAISYRVRATDSTPAVPGHLPLPDDDGGDWLTRFRDAVRAAASGGSRAWWRR
ncbi:hypothetical protein [Geodermatophilus sp. SYSU D01119]